MKSLLGIAVVAGWITLSLPDAAFAQIVVRTGDAGGASQNVNPMGQTLQWLWAPQIEKELDIVPEQKEALARLRSETLEKTRNLATSTAEGDPQSRAQRYQEATKALSDETEKKIQEILLPHQLRRLSQVMLQMKLKQAGYGSGKALAAGDLAEELGITEQQKAKLREKEQEVAQDIREKTQEFQKKLQEESREKLLSVLTPAQRKRLADLTGEPFEWQQQTYAAPVVLPAGGSRGAAAAAPKPLFP